MTKEIKHFNLKLHAILILISCLFIFNACSKDTPEMNTVRVQIQTNSDEPVRVYGPNDGRETGVVIKRKYNNTFKTESKCFSIDARCKDENTFITIKVWINGILKSNVSGNKYLTTGDISLL